MRSLVMAALATFAFATAADASGTQHSGSGGGAGIRPTSMGTGGGTGTHPSSCCNGAPINGPGTGVVTVIDGAGKTFTCHWRTGDWAYRTTDKTLFRIGGRAGSWSDVKVGETVRVTYHVDDHKQRVADRVTIAA